MINMITANTDDAATIHTGYMTCYTFCVFYMPSICNAKIAKKEYFCTYLNYSILDILLYSVCYLDWLNCADKWIVWVLHGRENLSDFVISWLKMSFGFCNILFWESWLLEPKLPSIFICLWAMENHSSKQQQKSSSYCLTDAGLSDTVCSCIFGAE